MQVFLGFVVLTSMLAGLAAPLVAKGILQNDEELRLVQAAIVVVNGQVLDGCLAQPAMLEAEAKLVLRR